ncbi:hypothetical protein Barb4_04529 [Bacteroidales bacterium Barb4]|nr:hypothetical protein Barb4_04529 [Bacteroidales bacterium Barb4]
MQPLINCNKIPPPAKKTPFFTKSCKTITNAVKTPSRLPDKMTLQHVHSLTLTSFLRHACVLPTFRKHFTFIGKPRYNPFNNHIINIK